ncbi:hypothetical protein SERLA73DRAFT_68758 [Serpula lacrymans var. lacrymans S7.3]|uniref:Reverse transcriptase Ty1/copia-type domain-containing protein n=1 Tax=Serpula lacrymans var. lacrymans (strain S7.3) TaxID=936435 RepID=F8PI76_SERL3|nr:hypothetical protein SERLA73DRAFT_68758 [Serpula lacrymans var. lacrymans S7.3]
MTTIPKHNVDKIPLTATKPTLPSNMHNTPPKEQSISKIQEVIEREELTDEEADNQKEKNNMRERPTHIAALKLQGFYKSLNDGKLTAKSAHISEESDVSIEHNDYLMAYATGAADCDSPRIRRALQGPEKDHWTKTINEELSQLNKLHTWDVTDPPPGSNIIQSHFVK